MSEHKTTIDNPEREQSDVLYSDLAVPVSDVSSVAGSVKNIKQTTSERKSERERAQKCLENAALVSKQIKEHRKATAKLLGKPFEDDIRDTEMSSTMSEKTNYSVMTDSSTALSVQEALNIPGISESLANSLKQRESLMERIKQYKEISKKPIRKNIPTEQKDSHRTAEKKCSDNIDITKLTNIIKEKENTISIIQVKMKAMETTILDLQEKITEKDQIIESKNKATMLITDSLSKKEKDTMHLLEDTKQQMSKMQNNFVSMEMEWKEERHKLLLQLQEKDEIIKSLEEANTILENSRFEISVENSKLSEQLDLKLKDISELQGKVRESSIQPDMTDIGIHSEKGSLEIKNMEELTKKVELLEQINYQIRQTNKELENQLASMNTDTKVPKKGSPTRKGGRNAPSKMKSPWSQLSTESLSQESEKKVKTDKTKIEMLLQSLNKDILEKELIITQKDETISKLEGLIKEKVDIIDQLESNANLQTMELKDVETMTESDDSQPTNSDVQNLEEKFKTALHKIAVLNNEIDVANKNMIKVKSNTKLKLKQMQKSIDNFSKVSDANAEIVKLNEELHQLSQKVAELEEEKGNLQLHLVDYDGGRLTESEVYKKLVEMEHLAEARLKSITVLETQKFDLVQDLHDLQQKTSEMEDKLADMSLLQNEQVCSEMKLVQLEEQLDALSSSKLEMDIILENLKLDKEQLNGNIKMLQNEKEELTLKLHNYMQENIELTDKLEKLSAEKVSSAESIEIVESLTTQEKMELEEYNRSMDSIKKVDNTDSKELISSKEKLINETEELKSKIELFTQEREEVMEKMNKIVIENESLLRYISELEMESGKLSDTIKILEDEKHKLQLCNEELNLQIEELKRERIEMLKETVEVVKRASIDDIDIPQGDSISEEKTTTDKGINRSKSVKQLTKEILKLKNVIKEREDEIADCQMKILSLEEQQQKHKDLLQNNTSNEVTAKRLVDENIQLKEEICIAAEKLETTEKIQKENEILQLELQKQHQEYSSAINNWESRVIELEKKLLDYENKAVSYVNSLQQKDKEVTDYVNQITKLNDLSQKLKATVELLEEEKDKYQSSEFIKSSSKQITALQKSLSEYEEKLRLLEDEKNQLSSVKTFLESKNKSVDIELKSLQDALKDKLTLISDMQTLNHKQSEELTEALLQAKERDEEIHEIKLQLRKESIENEKLRTVLELKSKELNDIKKSYDDIDKKLNSLSLDKSSQNELNVTLENKNKELLEKLKKFALTIKKKTAANTDLENQLNETKKQLEKLNEKASLQGDSEFNERIKATNIEINRLQNQITLLEAQNREMQEEIQTLHGSSMRDMDIIKKLNEEITMYSMKNNELQSNLEILSKKVVECEIEQKNNINLSTKLACLEAEISRKQTAITDLSVKLQNEDEKLIQLKHSYEAKIQERDLYVENLQSEIDKYKGRIYRLEQSVSTMETSRQSLERKADQLDCQLQEKQKAYGDYSYQEDELVARLAVLMDHDRVVEKQLDEIEKENNSLKAQIIKLDDEIHKVQKSNLDLLEKNNTLEKQVHRLEKAESDLLDYQGRLYDMENSLKHLTNENHSLEIRKNTEFEDLEKEFNTQIENAIKDRKSLVEKCEKLSEHKILLETELYKCNAIINNLNANLQDLSSENERLIANVSSCSPVPSQAQDYTDQYVTEINNLNSKLNNKNEVIKDLNIKIKSLETNYSLLKTEIIQLTEELQSTLVDKKRLADEIESRNKNNDHLQMLLLQKEEQVKQLIESKKLIFEMNIPKTEGMTISSTIEPLNDDNKDTNIASLELQILDDAQCSSQYHTSFERDSKKIIESVQSPRSKDTSQNEEVKEPLISPKKAYVCQQQDDRDRQTERHEKKENDPFNSEEGWGFEANDMVDVVTPGLSYLNNQLQVLNDSNKKLKEELEVSNVKLSKALKKLKELKSINEMLKKDLKLSQQLSQSSFLDLAIENELSSNVNVLEKKIEDLNINLSKEKKEKETLAKQNEVLQNANERLVDMKEKMDSEVELWKYNFKLADGKLSSMQWGGDAKESNVSPYTSTSIINTETKVNNELLKLEKENDELQALVDNLSAQNKQLCEENKELRVDIDNIKQQLQQSVSSECDQCQNMQRELELLQKLTIDLENKNVVLSQNVEMLDGQINNLKTENKCLTHNYEEKIRLYEENEKEVSLRNTQLVKEIENIKILEKDAINKIESLTLELECVKSKSKDENVEKELLRDQSFEKKYVLEEKLNLMELNNQQLNIKCNQYKDEAIKLKVEINNLNQENDQLLSTVAELRSSIPSAMDQRGFEIAELWKQHLSQKENEFHDIERDLRNRLNAFQCKYEQLLESTQFTSEEETSKIIAMEQVISLQNKLKEKEEHLLSLQEDYAVAINQLEALRSEIEDEKLIYDNKSLMQQEEHEMSIKILTTHYEEQKISYEAELKNVQTQVTSLTIQNSSLQAQIKELSSSFETQIQNLKQQLQLKEREIFQKTHDFSVSLSQRNEEFECVRRQLSEFEKKVEEITFEKESELAILRLKIHEITDKSNKTKNELESENVRIAQQLNEKIVECTKLNKTITDLNKSLEEYANKTTETQIVLENQELDILSLKDEISNLKEMLKTASTKIEKHVTFGSTSKLLKEEDQPNILDKELLGAVPKAELDLALYMLHQRDVRCEELTMELTQLLEERDTLQLRLSDCLRSYEDLKLQSSTINVDMTCLPSVTELPITSINEKHSMAGQFVETPRAQTSRSSSISDPDGSKPSLQAKLTELRGVKHSRDVRFRHESEQRQMGMRLLQRDVANLPPEALDQLTQAQHTLSRDTQSTPTVLLNWLRGKSTPKVVDM